jgi:hypothetical protein
MAKAHAQEPQTPGKGSLDLDWLSFPALKGFLQSTQMNLLATLEGNCRRLEALSKTGLTAEGDRTRLAFTAYRRTLELLYEIREVSKASSKLSD